MENKQNKARYPGLLAEIVPFDLEDGSENEDSLWPGIQLPDDEFDS